MPRILFLTAYPIDDASCRYRVHQFIPYLQNAGYECAVRSFASESLFRMLGAAGRIPAKAFETLRCAMRRLKELTSTQEFDFIVIHREVFPFFQPVLEKWLMRRHRNVIFSFDDAIYAGHEDSSELNHPVLYRWKHGHGCDEAIRLSRHVIAGNRILADYARRLNSQVTVIPTVVDCNQYQFAPSRRGDNSSVTIGWIGSRTTRPYLKAIEPALLRLAGTYPDKLHFRFVGCPDYSLDVQHCESVPFVLARELDELRTFDIGLMPLPDSEWARGKCAFKAIQYMASGAVTVASPVGITADIIKHDVNGFLASTNDEWFDRIDRLIRDAELRQRLAVNARRTIENSFSLQCWAPRLVDLFDQLRVGSGMVQPETVAA